MGGIYFLNVRNAVVIFFANAYQNEIKGLASENSAKSIGWKFAFRVRIEFVVLKRNIELKRRRVWPQSGMKENIWAGGRG
jgi:hypothetical protein